VCTTEPRNVIGGYTAAGRDFSAILIGDYEERALKFVAKVHAGFTHRCAGGSFPAIRWPRNEERARSRTCPRRPAVSGAIAADYAFATLAQCRVA
jgi:hypothetical protein